MWCKGWQQLLVVLIILVLVLPLPQQPPPQLLLQLLLLIASPPVLLHQCIFWNGLPNNLKQIFIKIVLTFLILVIFVFFNKRSMIIPENHSIVCYSLLVAIKLYIRFRYLIVIKSFKKVHILSNGLHILVTFLLYIQL